MCEERDTVSILMGRETERSAVRDNGLSVSLFAEHKPVVLRQRASIVLDPSKDIV